MRELKLLEAYRHKDSLRPIKEHELLGISATLRCQTAWSFISVQSVRGTTRASLLPPLRGQLALACSGTSSHGAAHAIESDSGCRGEAAYKYRNVAANPGAPPDGKRKSALAAR